MPKIHGNVLNKIKKDKEGMIREVSETNNRDRKERIRLVYYSAIWRYLRNAGLL